MHHLTSFSKPWRALALLTMLLLMAAPLTASPALAQASDYDFSQLPTQFGGSVFRDNLTVGAGIVYEDDVVVIAGNATVERGGRIAGDLFVLSGNVEVQEGGEVEGDVSAVSGNVLVGGQVGGDIATLSGNIQLLATAQVDGNVSLVSGNLERAPGAEVGGDVIHGQGFPFSQFEAPQAGGRVEAAQRDFSNRGRTFWSWIGGLILRLVLAVILTGVVVTLVALLHNLRPDLLRPVYGVMRERTAFSFIVGLLVNLVLAVLTAVFFASLILCIGGIFTGALLLGLNLIGWAVVSQYTGERLARYIQTPIQPVARVALGALLLTGVTTLLWALGGCFQFFGFLLWLLVSSTGVGAAVVRWLKLDSRLALPPPPAATEGAPPTPPAGPEPGEQPSAPPASPPDLTPARLDPETNVLASLEGQAPPAPPPAGDQPPAGFATPRSPVDEAVQLPEADFTVIRGIGPTFDRRLKSAGVRTFAQLANLTPEELAVIVGWTPQRVVNDDLIGQARRLSEAIDS